MDGVQGRGIPKRSWNEGVNTLVEQRACDFGRIKGGLGMGVRLRGFRMRREKIQTSGGSFKLMENIQR